MPPSPLTEDGWDEDFSPILGSRQRVEGSSVHLHSEQPGQEQQHQHKQEQQQQQPELKQQQQEQQQQLEEGEGGELGCRRGDEGSGKQAPSFISHKVSSKDTLAGIAIKYNVSVADIKRFNGLLSDTALYARDTVLVPTKLYPVGEELQVIFAQVASGFGRDPILNADAHLSPASSAVTRVARTLQLDDAVQFPLQGDASFCCELMEDAPLCGYKSGSSSGKGHFEPGEVELMERSPDGTMFLLPSTSGGGPTRLHDPMRRRRHGGTSLDNGAASESLSSSSLPNSVQPRAQGPHGQPLSATSNGRLPPRSPLRASSGPVDSNQPHQGMFNLKQLGKAIGDSAWVQRIKAAANQPALANGRMSSLTQTAEGVLSSLRQGTQLGGAGEGGKGGSSMRRSSSAQAHMGGLGVRASHSSGYSGGQTPGTKSRGNNLHSAPLHSRSGSSGSKVPDKSD